MFKAVKYLVSIIFPVGSRQVTPGINTAHPGENNPNLTKQKPSNVKSSLPASYLDVDSMFK